MNKKITRDMADFIYKSPTAYQAAHEVEKRLTENGFVRLQEGKRFQIEEGGKYYVMRNHSAVLAFHVGRNLTDYSFNIGAAHMDSPMLKIKEVAENRLTAGYVKLNTEPYGGMILSSWMDRPLSIAGRCFVKEGNRIVHRLVCFDRDLVMLPNLAIHMFREVNEKGVFNKQIDMMPTLGAMEGKATLKMLIAKELGVKEDDIIGSDLYIYNRTAPSIWGADEEFVSLGRLDDMQCIYGCLEGFLQGSPVNTINVLACFDNEEVGSSTKQGADSMFLYEIMERINLALKGDKEEFLRAISQSMMISCDNVHAVHPNHPEHYDPLNRCFMNQGIVIKTQAGQKYTSDGQGIAMINVFAEQAGVPVQYFANRSDKMTGRTLGHLSATHVSVRSVDIGLPQLAMHSSYETAGTKDTAYLIALMRQYYRTDLTSDEEGDLMIRHQE